MTIIITSPIPSERIPVMPIPKVNERLFMKLSPQIAIAEGSPKFCKTHAQTTNNAEKYHFPAIFPFPMNFSGIRSNNIHAFPAIYDK